MPKNARFSKLNGENYTRWAFCMEVLLRQKKLWSIVDTRIPDMSVRKYVVSESSERSDTNIEKTTLRQEAAGERKRKRRGGGEAMPHQLR